MTMAGRLRLRVIRVNGFLAESVPVPDLAYISDKSMSKAYHLPPLPYVSRGSNSSIGLAKTAAQG